MIGFIFKSLDLRIFVADFFLSEQSNKLTLIFSFVKLS